MCEDDDVAKGQNGVKRRARMFEHETSFAKDRLHAGTGRPKRQAD